MPRWPWQTEWPETDGPPPQIPSKVFNDVELAQFILIHCAELGFPLDQVLDGKAGDDAHHHLELFLDFCHNSVHGLQRPGVPWAGAERYVLPEHRTATSPKQTPSQVSGQNLNVPRDHHDEET